MGINEILFRYSHLYQYLALTFGERARGPRDDSLESFLRTRLAKVPTLAAAAGADLMLFLAPPLDRSFVDLTRAMPEWQSMELKFAEERRIPAFTLQQELAAEDYLQVRLDPCCHYNAAGHRALVPIFERKIAAMLQARLARDNATRPLSRQVKNSV